ncbi:MAG: acyl carrier protein [Actinomycetota bacterium]|nr:acyl carrier protein [Actinomycetota bacterium]
MQKTHTREEIEAGIFDAIATFGPDRESVTRDATFETLDVDSLDLVELAQIVEEDFGIRVETSDFKDIVTVGQAVDAVLAKVAATEAPA